MSNNKRKQLLSEGEVRKFMKFANIGLDVSDQFLSENYGEELEEGDPARKEKKKPDYKDQMDKEIDDVDKNLKKSGLTEAGGMEPELGEEGPPEDLEGGDEMDMGGEEDMPEMEDELPEPDMGAEAAEVTITPEELEVLTKVLGDLVAVVGGGEAGDEMDMGGEEELPPEPDMGGDELDMGGDEELPEEEPMMEGLVNKIAQRVAKRLMKKS
tara:strand:- start:17582 stop:18217 length:636 start_codon:yes stop_codon:yes gene_type:complete